MNVEKPKVIGVSKQPSTVQITIDGKTTGESGYLQLFGYCDNKLYKIHSFCFLSYDKFIASFKVSSSQSATQCM